MNLPPRFPQPANEPAFDYRADAAARSELDAHLKSDDVVEIPTVIGGRRVFSGDIVEVRSPHDRSRLLARIHRPSEADIQASISEALRAAKDWSALPFEKRAAVFLRAADIIAREERHMITAVTMLGQGKTLDQAEPDAVGELIDFMRFNVFEAQKIFENQPLTVADAANRIEWRPLEGFVYAVSPFNFTAIGANLACGPALMGNVCVWKPSDKSALANYRFFEILERAGLPPGVINFIPAEPVLATRVALGSREFAGLHFTGSSQVFKSLWRTVGENIETYRGFPRIVGETGGKGFLVAHASANPVEVTTALIRAAFEYSGQKCSATSRAYIPKSLWPEIRAGLQARLSKLQIGDVANQDTFMGAVIDEASYRRTTARIEKLKGDNQAKVVYGGKSWTEPGWFIEPTVVEVTDPKHELMCTELFAPVLAVFVYEDADWEQTLRLVDSTSDYALTGSIYCLELGPRLQAESVLSNAAGNIYVNHKTTGAVVGQQPFGGARASGTNDKAGSWMNLLRWTSPRVVKEAHLPEAAWDFVGS